MYQKIFLAIFLCSAAPVIADEAISIDQLVKKILAAHPELSALEAAQDAAQATARQAALKPNPEFSTEFGFKNADTETDSENGYEVSASLEESFERQGKREARIAIANAERQISEQTLNLHQRELETRVRKLAYEYLVADADAQAADEVSRRSDALIQMLKQRPTAGAPMLLELRVIEASLIELRSTVLEFAGQRDDARIALNTLLDRSPDKPLTLDGKLTPPSDSYNFTTLRKNLAEHPQLQIFILELARQTNEVQAATLDAKSDHKAGPFFSHEETGDETETLVGFSFSMDLPWRNRKQGNIAAASARRIQADKNFEAEQKKLEGELAQKLQAYQRAIQQLKSIPEKTVEELHAAADLAERQYRLGAISVQLFLDVQREYLNVQKIRHQTLLDAWHHALDLQALSPEQP